MASWNEPASSGRDDWALTLLVVVFALLAVVVVVAG